MTQSLPAAPTTGTLGEILAAASDAIVVTNLDQRVIGWNPAAERLYGIEAADALGFPLDDVLETRIFGRDADIAELREAVRAGGEWHGRVTRRPRAGHYVGRELVVEIAASPLLGVRGAPAGIVYVGRDVTPLALLEERLAGLAAHRPGAPTRTRKEVADAALDILCDTLGADQAVIVTTSGDGYHLEASRNLSDALRSIILSFPRAGSPALAAMEQAGTVLHGPIESSPLQDETKRAVLAEGLTSYAMVSLLAADERVGWLSLTWKDPSHAQLVDAVLVQVASQLAVALENARLFEEVGAGLEKERQLTARLETLVGLLRFTTATGDEEAFTRSVIEQIVAALGARGGMVMRIQGDALEPVADAGVDPRIAPAIRRLPPDQSVTIRRFKNGEPAFLERVDPVRVKTQIMRIAAEVGYTAWAAFPLRDDAELLGAVLMYFDGPPDRIALDDRTLDAIGRIVSIAFANQRLRHQLTSAAQAERQLAEQLQALQEITLLGGQSTDLPGLSEGTGQRIADATGASSARWLLIDPQTDRLAVVWSNEIAPLANRVRDHRIRTRLEADGTAIVERYDQPTLPMAQRRAGLRRGLVGRAVLPLHTGQGLAGWVDLAWTSLPVSGLPDRAALDAIARLASISLANFRLREELVARVATERALALRLDTLDELTRVGQQAATFEELAARTVGLVRDALAASAVQYLALDGDRLTRAGTTGARPPFDDLVVDRGAAGWSGYAHWEAGGGSVFRAFSPGEVTEDSLELAAQAGYTAYGAIPVRMDGVLVGAIACYFDQPLETIHVGEDVLDSVARIAEISLANFRLRERLVQTVTAERHLVDQLAALQSLTMIGESAVDFGDLARSTVEQIAAAIGAAAGSYGVLGEGDRFVDTVFVNVHEPFGDWVISRPASSTTPVRRFEVGGRAYLQRYDDDGAVSPPSRERARQAGYTAYAALPVVVEDRLEAVVLLYFDRPADEIAIDPRSLDAIGRIASISLANFRLRERLVGSLTSERHLIEQVSALQSLTMIGETATDLAVLAGSTVERVVASLGASAGRYLLVDDGQLREVQARSVAEPFQDIEVSAEEVPARRFLSFLQPYTAPSVSPDLRERAERAGYSAYAGLPIRLGDRLGGAILVYFERPLDSISVDPRSLDVISRIASISLANFRLRERLVTSLASERLLVDQVTALQSLTMIGETATDLHTLLRATVERVVGALGASGGSYALVEGDELVNQVSVNVSAAFGAGNWRRKAGDVSAMRRFLAGEGSHVQAYEEGQVSADSLTRARQARYTGYAAMPIRVADRLEGALIVYLDSALQSVALETRTLDAISRIASISLANFRLRERLVNSLASERRLIDQGAALQSLTMLGETATEFSELATLTLEQIVAALGGCGGRYLIITDDGRVSAPAVVSVDERIAALHIGKPINVVPPFQRFMAGESSYLQAYVTGVHDQAFNELAWSAGYTAYAALPTKIGDRLEGVLVIYFDRPVDTIRIDPRSLEAIARIASISLANFRLRERLLNSLDTERRLIDQGAALQSLTKIGETATDFSEVARSTLEQVISVLGGCGGRYLIITDDGRVSVAAMVSTDERFLSLHVGSRVADVPPFRRFLDGEGPYLQRYETGAHDEQINVLARAAGYSVYAALPTWIDDRLGGVLIIYFDQPVESIRIDPRSLESIARIASISLANFRLREGLLLSEERYRSLFTGSPDAYLVVGREGRILDANAAAATLYGVPIDKLVGRRISDVSTLDQAEFARQLAGSHRERRGTFQQIERRADGSTFPAAIDVSFVLVGGEPRTLMLVHDLSEQVRLQQELMQAQKMDAIGQLVSGVAHELNNPLAAIIAFSQLLARDNRLPDDMRHDADIMVQEADRTRRIVQNLLDFARQRPPERHSTPVGTLISSVMELQSYSLSAGRIEVTMDVPPDVPSIDVDRAQMQQVVLNLTINAIQAIRAAKRPGHIAITARQVEDPEGRAFIRIAISDDGPGVPADVRSRLFLPFFTTKEPGQGTGLGLSVSFGIVAAHGGRLWYEPGPNERGASFVMEIPIVDSAALSDVAETVVDVGSRAAAPAPHEGRVRRSGQKVGANGAEKLGGDADRPLILILDDEPSIRTFLAKALQSAGLDTIVTENGQEALERVQDRAIDGLLVDHRMAGMSGTEVYEAVVSRRPDLASRFVFMSGDVLNPELRDFAANRGVSLLAKPFDLDTVKRTVREMLGMTAEEGRVRPN